MDPQLEELYGPLHRIRFSDQMGTNVSSHSFGNELKLQDSDLNPRFANPSYVNVPSTAQNLDVVVPSISPGIEGGSHEDYDFSDLVLEYINQVLMEEDEFEKTCMYHEPSALEAAEKSFYEVIGEKYTSAQTQQHFLPEVKGNQSGSSYGYSPQHIIDFSCVEPSSKTSHSSSHRFSRQVDVSHLNSSSPFSSTSNVSGLTDGPADSPVSALSVSDIFGDSRSMLQFRKGLEEASKFLPKGSLYVGTNAGACDTAVKLETNGGNGALAQGVSRGKKHRHPEELLSEGGRGSKQSATSPFPDEAVMRSEMFDRVLLCSEGKHDAALREALQSELNKNVHDTQPKGSQGGKGRRKKSGSKRDVVDLRSLLSLCAQAVASHDQRSANDLLKKIRQHSSPIGDGNQRMAHYFADGLEARLAGVGTPIYSCIVSGPGSAVDMLRAYHMFLATCPFKKIANFTSNWTIMAAAEKAKRLHIIDLGILYGFQWPSMIQRLSTRPGGPPKLRISGVDLPQPGFRPTKRVEETGRRLKNYAESFNVPFEFNPIAKKWETLTIEDLKIEDDEMLIVNAMFRFKYIPEETVIADCPRDIVLKLIKQIKPDVFIHGVVNGAFNSPFFITRFREAVFHFSTLFDMLEANLPRDIQERMLIEKEIFGRQAMNVIACEGLERIERPETYRQWQVRNERVGFSQLPLNRELVELAKKRVRSVYHKDFSIDEDGHWLLQGWKGRIVYALSTWKPVD